MKWGVKSSTSRPREAYYSELHLNQKFETVDVMCIQVLLIFNLPVTVFPINEVSTVWAYIINQAFLSVCLDSSNTSLSFPWIVGSLSFLAAALKVFCKF